MKRSVIILSVMLLIAGIAAAQKRKPKIKMKTSPTTIAIGDSVMINWNCNKIDSIFITAPYKQKLELQGSLHHKPNYSTSLKFTGYRKKKMFRKTVNIIVNHPYLNIDAPKEITDEKPAIIKWQCAHAKKLMLHNHSDSLPLTGNITLALKKTDTLKFTAINAFGHKNEENIIIRVREIEELRYPEKIAECATATISWKFKNASKVLLMPQNQEFPNNGFVNLSIQPNTQYSLLVIKNSGDTITKPLKMEILPRKITLKASRSSILKGKTVKLSWNAQGFDSLHFENNPTLLPNKKEITLKPKKNTIYTLYGTNRCTGLQDSKSVEVFVLNRRYIKTIKDIKDVKTGVKLNAEIFATDFSKYPEEVKLYVLVVDSLGNYISNLENYSLYNPNVKNFFKQLTEHVAGKANHQVQYFTVKEVRHASVPIDINLTLDYSGSMSGEINLLEKALKEFILNKHNADRISLVRFDDSLALECPLLGNKDELWGKIKFNGLKYFGGLTALYAAADEGLRTFLHAPFQKQLILFTDGYENSSFQYFGYRATTAQQIALKAFQNNIRIHVLTFGSSVNEPVLRALTEITGGNFYNIFDRYDIKNVIKELQIINRNYYVITYKPMQSDGQREIELTYYNNESSKPVSTNRQTHVGDKFDLNTMEYKNDFDTSHAYQNPANFGKTKMLLLPQVVALFDFNKADLKPTSLAILDKYFAFLKTRPNAVAVVMGHTDMVGEEKYCLELSLKRAENVKKYLLQKGINENQIITQGFGKSQPVWKTEEKPIHAIENRRVEIMILE